MESPPTARRFAKEFLTASAIFALCLLWIFRTPLLSRQVEAFDARPQASGALLNLQESLYEVESAIVVQTRMVKEGFFPSWSPYSAGGTPLIAKMQNAVFAPEHLLLYVFPLAAIPFLFMLVVAWKLYLAFIFTYLYGRSLRLTLFGGIFAGIVYVFSEAVTGGLLSWSAGAPYLPLLLLLVETYLRGHRRLAQLLLPWAVAFTFFSGHFESATYICLVTGVYFLGRLAIDGATTWSEKFRQFVGFLIPSAVGLILAGVQIAPAYEYVQNSYSKAWHNPSWFWFWDYESISKHLSMDDVPMMGAGIAGLFLFILALRRSITNTEKPPTARLLPLAVAALSLSWTVACLANLGLDDSLSRLACCHDTADLLGWVSGFFLLFLSFWVWRAPDQPAGIRILGGILIGSIVLMLKFPLLTNALLHVPPFDNFHNASGHRWEFNLATAVLCAAAIQRIPAVGRESWSQRLAMALRSFCVLGVFLFGYLGSQPLKGIVARLIPTGIDVQHGQAASDGGIMGPARQITYNRTETIVGWVPVSPPISSIAVELTPASQSVGASQVMADVSRRGPRFFFHALVPVPAQAGETTPSVLITYADGTKKTLSNGKVEVRSRGRSPLSGWVAVAAVIFFPLIFLSGAVLPRIASVLLMAWMMGQYTSVAIPASQRPYRLGGMDKIREDRDLTRIGALQFNFLTADYPGVYDIADIRPGGDNIDVLAHMYFYMLGSTLMGYRDDPSSLNLHNAQKTGSFDAGLRLFGLANVKYFIDFPDSKVTHPGLELFYHDDSMTVFRNKYSEPRAAFYDKLFHIPLDDWKNYGNKDRLLMPIEHMLDSGTLNDKHFLMMNDLPAEPFPSDVRGGAAESSVLIRKYSPDKVLLDVDAPRPGVVFLSDTLFPGWVAYRNGVEVPILRSWLTFRAIQVGAGKSVVEFLYRPVVLLTALSLSVAASLIWLFLYYRHKLHAPDSISASMPVVAKNKKKEVAALEPADKESGEDVIMIGLCSSWAEGIEVSLIAATLLFWTVWAAVNYGGGIQRGWRSEGMGINILAFAMLIGGAGVLLRDFKEIRHNGAKAS